MMREILVADLTYIKTELEELEKYLAESHDEMDPALLMVDDMIRHIDAFIEEDL